MRCESCRNTNASLSPPPIEACHSMKNNFRRMQPKERPTHHIVSFAIVTAVRGGASAERPLRRRSKGSAQGREASLRQSPCSTHEVQVRSFTPIMARESMLGLLPAVRTYQTSCLHVGSIPVDVDWILSSCSCARIELHVRCSFADCARHCASPVLRMRGSCLS